MQMKKMSIAFAVTMVALMGSPSTVLGQVGTNNDLLNPNRASEDELLGVPHLDADAVDAILEGRPFLDA